MMNINVDVLLLIFEELKNEKNSLFSCLLVNRTWCEVVVPILWKNPGRFHMSSYSIHLLLNVIFSHLSDVSKDVIFKKYRINIDMNLRPSFNYINFWKCLDLLFITTVITSGRIAMVIKDWILKLFINRDTKFIHLSIPGNSNCILFGISGGESCFSELESLDYNYNKRCNQNVLSELVRKCRSIKKLRLSNCEENSEIVKLIEVQKNLNEISFAETYSSFYKSLEKSLIKHANTIHYLSIDWIPITISLSYFVNLSSLEINLHRNDLNYSGNLSLPNLKYLRTKKLPPKDLANLIEKTNGYLIEISATYDDIDSKIFYQAIYQNCPNLRYLCLSLVNYKDNDSLILEFKKLLINCQFLRGLIIKIINDNMFRWDRLFTILANSSPISLYRFKFSSDKSIESKNLKLFFDNWKDRNPIMLVIISYNNRYNFSRKQMEDLIKRYKAMGIISKYSMGFKSIDRFENFEWI